MEKRRDLTNDRKGAVRLYRYEVIVTPTTARKAYSILCREWQEETWKAVAVTSPLSGGLDAVAQLARSCTERNLAPDQLLDAAFAFLAQTGAAQ